MKSDLDIIIPVFNEGNKINKLYELFNKYLNLNFRLLICYDFEGDNTLKYIKKIKNYKEKITLIKNENFGPNEAIKKGLKESESDILLVYMADDFDNIDLINKMYEIIKNENYHLVVPSRFITGGQFIGASFIKKYITILGSFLIYYLGRVPIRDSTNAFKMFNKNVLNSINIKSSKGFTYALELTIKCHKKKFRIKEVPSVWKDIEGRKSKFKIYRWLPSYVYLLFISVIS